MFVALVASHPQMATVSFPLKTILEHPTLVPKNEDSSGHLCVWFETTDDVMALLSMFQTDRVPDHPLSTCVECRPQPNVDGTQGTMGVVHSGDQLVLLAKPIRCFVTSMTGTAAGAGVVTLYAFPIHFLPTLVGAGHAQAFAPEEGTPELVVNFIEWQHEFILGVPSLKVTSVEKGDFLSYSFVPLPVHDTVLGTVLDAGGNDQFRAEELPASKLIGGHESMAALQWLQTNPIPAPTKDSKVVVFTFKDTLMERAAASIFSSVAARLPGARAATPVSAAAFQPRVVIERTKKKPAGAKGGFPTLAYVWKP